MAVVELRFPPGPEHVRTARLVATAVARRAGVVEERLDELRLAVGEACARAVRRSALAGVTVPVLLRIEDGSPGMFVEVVDAAGLPAEDDPVVLALLKGLADSVEVDPDSTGTGGRVRLGWLTVTGPPASGEG